MIVGDSAEQQMGGRPTGWPQNYIMREAGSTPGKCQNSQAVEIIFRGIAARNSDIATLINRQPLESHENCLEVWAQGRPDRPLRRMEVYTGYVRGGISARTADTHTVFSALAATLLHPGLLNALDCIYCYRYPPAH
jgi:hypothetical protein